MTTKEKFALKRKEAMRKKVMSDEAKTQLLKENLDPNLGIGGGSEEELEDEVFNPQSEDSGKDVGLDDEPLPEIRTKESPISKSRKPIPTAVLALKYNRFFLKNKVKPEHAAVLTLATMVAELSVVVSRLSTQDVTRSPDEINTDDLDGLSIS